MSNQSFMNRLLSLAVVVFAVTACSPQSSTAAPAAQDARSGAPADAAAPTAAPAATGAALTAKTLPDFAGLVELYGRAVVNVQVVEKRQAVQLPGMDEDGPFGEFFRRFGMPMPRGENMPPSRGEGSGFIVSADGYILTNAHVVADAEEVTVKMTDRREYTAKVIGADRRTDVALIKIDAKNLPVVKLGDPNKLRPGEWVVAIGSPFGFENSVTAGIVSATGRSMPGDDSIVPFIQTDVAVNPGNSGGPLFNLQGEVVGINSQIYSRSGGYMGLSFAIPIDVANNVRSQLATDGRVTRGRIGVQIQEVNAQLAESFGLDRPRGALVGRVEPDGPAAKGGIKAGDVILSVEDVTVERSGQLPGMIANVKPGTKVDVTVWRDRQNKKLTLMTDEFKEQNQRVGSSSDGGTPREADKLGLTIRPLTSDEQGSADTQGKLLVESVTGPAAAAGVQRGDIILGVNGKSVTSVKQLRDATEKSSGTVALLVERQGTQIFLPVKIG